MSASVLIESQAFKRYVKRIGSKRGKLRPKLADCLKIIGAGVRGRLAKAAPRNTGVLANSTKAEVDETNLTLTFVNRQPHALPMEHGTKHKSQPPTDALIPWVQSKLGVSGDEAASVAFLVARAIRRRGGLKARNWFGPTIRTETPFMRAQFQKCMNEYAKEGI